jgi:hypothetical protein
MSEQRVWSPVWLELSGLPEWLNARVRQGAWTVFKKLVEADCEANFRPAPFEMTVSDLSRRTGLKVEAVERILAGLRRKRLISCFIPEHPDENLLCQIATPLPLPEPRDAVLARLPRAMQRDELRYLDQVALSEESENVLREIVDGYLNNVSQKMNPMILDELRLVAVRFPRERIRKMFARARHVGVDSLAWVTRELIREESHGQKTGKH